MQDKKGFFALLFNAILLGTYSVWIRFFQRTLSGYQQVTARSLTSFFLAVLLLFILKTGWHIEKKYHKHLGLYLFFFAVSTILFTLAVIQTSIALSVFGLYIGSLLSAFFLGSMVFEEKLQKEKWISIILVFLALLLLTQPFSTNIFNLGFFTGIAAGVFDGIGNAFKKFFGGKIERPLLIVFQIFSTLFIAVLLTLFVHQQVLPSQLSTTTIMLLCLYGIVFLAVAYLSMYGFQHFNLNVGTIVISSELFWAPFFALLIFHETLTMYEILGGILIGVAIVVPYIKPKTVKQILTSQTN